MTQSQAQKKAAKKSVEKARVARAGKPPKQRAVAQLEAQLGQVQQALLVTRGMYDQKVLDLDLANRTNSQNVQLITAILVEMGDTVVNDETLEAALLFQGFNIEENDGDGFRLVLMERQEDEEA
jgi:hypothetical protein